MVPPLFEAMRWIREVEQMATRGPNKSRSFPLGLVPSKLKSVRSLVLFLHYFYSFPEPGLEYVDTKFKGVLTKQVMV